MDELEAAWDEAKRELRAWAGRMAAANPDEEWGAPEDWTLAVQQARDGVTAWVYDPLTDAPDPVFAMEQADGATPAAALRSLASRLTTLGERP